MGETSIRFLGGAGGVTGSCTEVTTKNGKKFIIDCGTYQGADEDTHLNYEPFDFDLSEVDAVFFTHAHLDHIGRGPRLRKAGYRGKFFMTKPTAEIARISLQDQVNINRESGMKPLYSPRDYAEMFDNVEIVNYNQPIEIGGCEFNFRNANHILGSMYIEIHEIGRGCAKIVFSGDLGRNVGEGANDADFAIIESTYGDRNHLPVDSRDVLQYETNKIEEQKTGTLLIATFAIDRSAKIIRDFSDLQKKGLIDKNTAFYFSSPMGLRALEVYRNNLNHFKTDSRGKFTDEYEDLFKMRNFVPVLDRKAKERVPKEGPPKVILASSGMLEGGRIIELLQYYLLNRKNRLLLTGYQGVKTLGREIADYATEIDKLMLDDFSGRIWDSKKDSLVVEIGKQPVQIAANLAITGSFSSHADQSNLVRWLSGVNANGACTAIINHGSPEASRELSRVLNIDFRYNTFIPKRGEKIAY